MIAFVRILSQRTASHRDVEAFKTLLAFSALGLLVSLLFLLNGIDVGPGLF